MRWEKPDLIIEMLARKPKEMFSDILEGRRLDSPLLLHERAKEQDFIRLLKNRRIVQEIREWSKLFTGNRRPSRVPKAMLYRKSQDGYAMSGEQGVIPLGTADDKRQETRPSTPLEYPGPLSENVPPISCMAERIAEIKGVRGDREEDCLETTRIFQCR